MTEESLIKSAARLLRAFDNIQFAYLFGSAARGVRAPRDADIAVFLKKDMSPLKSLSFRLRLTDELKKRLGMDVDLVILNGASPFLKHQVLKYGQLIFKRSAMVDSEFRYDTMTEYFDMLPLHDFFASGINGKKRSHHGRYKTR